MDDIKTTLEHRGKSPPQGSKLVPQRAQPPICPFMSNIAAEVSCTPDCKLFRSARRGYECYIQELQSISWNTRVDGKAPPRE